MKLFMNGFIAAVLFTALLFSCSSSPVNLAQSGTADKGGLPLQTEKAFREPVFFKGQKPLALINARIIDGIAMRPQEGLVILVKAGKIEKIIPTEKFETQREYKIIDMKESYLLSGFINAHVHQAYNKEQLESWLQGGVTSVRDLSPFDEKIQIIPDFIQIRDQLRKEAGNAFLISATPGLTAEGGYGMFYVNSPEEAGKAVKNFSDSGVDLIKFCIEDYQIGRAWNLLPEPEINMIVSEAHSLGKKVSVHITHSRNLKYAISAGVDDVNHMVPDDVEDTDISAMIKKGITWIPTLELWYRVDVTVGTGYLDGAKHNLRKFYKAGGKIALGTDFAGFGSNFDTGFPLIEVTQMKEAGVSNEAIIQAGTKNAAEVCGFAKELGTLEEGKWADIIAVEKNPLEDITSLGNVNLVIHQGVVVKNKIK